MRIILRPYDPARDPERISALLNEIDQLNAREGIRRARTPQELRTWFENPELQPEDSVVCEDEDGAVRGYALLECSRHGQQRETLLGELRFNTHPANSPEDLDGQVIAWAEKRLRRRDSDAARIELQANATHSNVRRIFTLKWHGFSVVRHFVKYVPSAEPPRRPAKLATGLQVAPPRP